MPVEFDPFADLSDEELDAMVEAAGDAGAAYGLVAGDTPEGFRSGFVALVGRPNAGKSTLLNACVGTKVAITSPVAQTTRRRMRAVVNRDEFQLVFVDTPGMSSASSLASMSSNSSSSRLSRSSLSMRDDLLIQNSRTPNAARPTKRRYPMNPSARANTMMPTMAAVIASV